MKNVISTVFIFTAFSLHAQVIRITGNISESNEPLPGTTLKVKGTSTRTLSDFDGNFAITAKKGDLLEFSYLGFITQEVEVSDSTEINVILEEDTKALVEVITFKCFAKLKYNLPFKVYEINNNNWQTQKDMYNAIQAIVPNVNLSTSVPKIKMRGDDNTIVIVDGVRYDASILNTLSPTDIEQISVATDPTAATYLLSN